MKIHALRLRPNQDLKKELIKFTKENNINAGFIITCVGSLRKATLRMSDENIIKDYENRFEINALSGTLCQDDVHLHVSLSDENGNGVGGHLKEGCIIYVTAEIIIGEIEDATFSREFDKETGFNELKIRVDK
ncbi:MAG: hypothetical protein QT00_C0001G0068 [archaeon GW2011_AR5]|nr:MAG: hypothetical protein QT00_C0001G0068 [archaeon GW2011_AR5]